MEILIDAGGRWNLPSSQRILKAIEPYNVIHFEDIQIPSNAQQAYAVWQLRVLYLLHTVKLWQQGMN